MASRRLAAAPAVDAMFSLRVKQMFPAVRSRGIRFDSGVASPVISVPNAGDQLCSCGGKIEDGAEE